MNGKVYFNRKKKCYSVVNQGTGRVAFHANSLTIKNAHFRVSKAGVDRIRRTGKRTVVATINGDVEAKQLPVPRGMKRVRFDPFLVDSFYVANPPGGDVPILEAEVVYCTLEGVFV